MHQSADINFLAVVLAAISSFIVGALWYGPILGKAWMKEIGKTEEELKENFNPAKTYGLAFVGQFIMTYVLARFLSYVEAATLIEYIRIGFLCWLGFAGAAIFINYLFSSKSYKLLFIDVFYFFFNLIISSIILYLF